MIRYVRSVLRLMAETVRFGISGRRPGLMLVLLIGILLSLVVLSVQFLAPALLYPFI